MFSFAMLKHNNDIPNDIPPELTASRYSTLMPIILVAFGQISVGTIASLQTSDLAFVIITLLSVVVTDFELPTSPSLLANGSLPREDALPPASSITPSFGPVRIVNPAG